MSEYTTYYRAAKNFKFGARTFTKGEIVRASDPVVEALSHRPDLLLLTITCTERPPARPASRRPTMAGVPSVQERRPSRDCSLKTRAGACPKGEDEMPEHDTDVLIVTAPFTHNGEKYERGDELPVRHRWVRRTARENPGLFSMRYVPVPVDMELLDELDREQEANYRQLLDNREKAKAAHEAELRRELAEQKKGDDPALKRAYAKQAKDREEREKQQREDRERERLERILGLQSGLN